MIWRRVWLVAATIAVVVGCTSFPSAIVSGAQNINVRTDSAGSVTSTTAHLNGTLLSLGDYTSANVSFQWNALDFGSTTYETGPQSLTKVGGFSADLTGLSADTWYAFRAKGIGLGPTDYGAWQLFITPHSVVRYSLTITSGSGGTITNPGLGTHTYNAGQVVGIVAAPSSGYRFVNWTGDNSTVASATTASTTITMSGNYSIQANFAIKTYTLTYNAGTGGTISGTSPQTVSAGGSGSSVTAVPNTGFHFVSWSDGIAAASRTDSNITVNLSVTANFAADVVSYTLTYNAGTGGTISGTSPQTVSAGGSGSSVTAAPNTSFHFVSWSDGIAAASRTDSNITVNLSVTANFAADVVSYTLTYNAGTGGTISGTSPQTVAAGGSGSSVTAVPNTGFHFVSWGDGIASASRTDLNVTANLSVTANFAQDVPPAVGGSGLAMGGGGTGGPPYGSGITNLTGFTNGEGVFNLSAMATSEDASAKLAIAKGVRGQNSDGSPLKFVSIAKSLDAGPAPGDSILVTQAYDFGPNGAAFDPAVTLEFAYDRTLLPQGLPAKNLTVATWNAGSGTWTEIKSTIDTAAGRALANVDHFSLYAVIARARPATFVVGGLTISPSEGKPGDPVAVGVRVANEGDLAGTFAVFLKVDGKVQSSRDVALGGNAGELLSFTFSSETAGAHEVEVNGLTGTFVTSRPAGPPKFTVSLNISQPTVEVGKAPTVAVLVTNTGESAGDYNLVLTVNGQEVAKTDVVLAPNSEKTFEFALPADIPGNYAVGVNGQTTSYAVSALPVIPTRMFNWWLVGALVTALTAVSSLIVFRVRAGSAGESS